MPFKKCFLLLAVLLSACQVVFAQFEVDYLKAKDYHAVGFGGFLNVSVPATDAAYLSFEVGADYFNNEDEEVLLIPVLVGYRYTLDQSGYRFYLEPRAGYAFGATTIQAYDENDQPMYDESGDYIYEKVAGPTAGLTLGYLVPGSGWLQLNIGLSYDHSFGKTPTNMFSFRIAHAFSFGRRSYY